jgi:hypothetical protein
MATKEKIAWRKNKIMEYMAHGFTNQSELAQVMQLPLSTVHRDVVVLKQEAKEHVAKFEETFAFEFEKCLVEINAIQKESWLTSKVTKYERNKILALGLAKDCLGFKVDLITNADVIDKTANFVAIKKRKLQQMIQDEEDEQIQQAPMVLPADVTEEPHNEDQEIVAQ